MGSRLVEESSSRFSYRRRCVRRLDLPNAICVEEGVVERGERLGEGLKCWVWVVKRLVRGVLRHREQGPSRLEGVERGESQDRYGYGYEYGH
jgi:hypothetical protein